jgi:glycerol-3-phosphate acyltransferase PlsY
MDLYSIFLFLVPYLIGSIPTAVWISKFFFDSDVRTHGSGNAGSTNMFRVFGFKAGIATQLVDIAKGALAAALPILVLRYTMELHILSQFSDTLQAVICGLMAVAGHIFPVWAGFRGGKGINTLLGTILVADWRAGLIALGVFVVVLLITRYVSVSSMLGTLSFSIYLLVKGIITGEMPEPLLIGLAFFMFLIVVWAHRTNIQRLRKGNESRVGFLDKWLGKKGSDKSQ